VSAVSGTRENLIQINHMHFSPAADMVELMDMPLMKVAQSCPDVTVQKGWTLAEGLLHKVQG